MVAMTNFAYLTGQGFLNVPLQQAERFDISPLEQLTDLGDRHSRSAARTTATHPPVHDGAHGTCQVRHESALQTRLQQPARRVTAA